MRSGIMPDQLGRPSSLWALALVTAFVVLPTFTVGLPAMNDYPNHLARMYLLSSFSTADANPYYVYWLPYLYPNLAMDAVVPVLARIMSVALAAKSFLLLAQLLLISGAAVAEIAVKRHHEFGGFVAVALLYCLPFSWGFLNFQFGLGLSMWGLAAWFAIKRDDRWLRRLLVHAPLSFAIFVSHLSAFVIYAISLFMYEARQALYRRCGKAEVVRLAVLTAPATAITLYYLFSIIRAEGHLKDLGDGGANWDWLGLILSFLHGFNGYNTRLSLTYIVVVIVALSWMMKRKSLRMDPSGNWIAIGLLGLAVGLPFHAWGGELLNIRVLVAALLVLPAFIRLRADSTDCSMLAITLICIGSLNAIYTQQLWRAYQPQFLALEQSFQRISQGAFVLVAYDDRQSSSFDKQDTPIVTATALATHYAGAFVPMLFAIPGQQPVQVCPSLNSLALKRISDYWPLRISYLAQLSTGTDTNAPDNLRDWKRDYDYLYVFGPIRPNPIPQLLKLVASADRFTLYRILKGKPDGTGDPGGKGPSGARSTFNCGID